MNFPGPLLCHKLYKPLRVGIKRKEVIIHSLLKLYGIGDNLKLGQPKTGRLPDLDLVVTYACVFLQECALLGGQQLVGGDGLADKPVWAGLEGFSLGLFH